MEKLKLIFMGTPDFAVASLKALCEYGANIVAVVTVPDKPSGRGQQVNQSTVKKFALEHGLKILQPEKLKAPEFIEELRALKADLQLVVAFRMLPEIVWNMPRLGTYNLHASLLPKYRGAAPINWAIINGEKETGVTTFKLSHEIDTGDVLFRERVLVGEHSTAGELHDTLMKIGAELVVKTVKEIERCYENNIPLSYTKQNTDDATHAPKLFKDTCKIDWNKNANDIVNLVRGLSPYPCAFSELKNLDSTSRIIKIYRATANPGAVGQLNGALNTDDKKILEVTCNGGSVLIEELQLEGKKRMKAEEFLRGFKIQQGMYLA